MTKKDRRGGWSRGKGRAVAWLVARVNYEAESCLFWPFSAGTGYGEFSHEGKHYYAHRYMCELVNGLPPTPRHQAAHSCGNGRGGCVNPRHLSWKTNGENQRDRRKHGTHNRNHAIKKGKGSMAKFTSEQDAQIREMAKTMTQMEIAKHFGVTHSTIQYRLYGGSYKPRREKILGVIA